MRVAWRGLNFCVVDRGKPGIKEILGTGFKAGISG